MKATKRSQYALRAVIFLAREKGKVCSVRLVSEKENISFDYLEKVFSKLEKEGLVVSKKGATGGYVLAKSPSQISLKDVFNATEEPVAVVECILHRCPRDSSCRATRAWKKVNKKLEKTFREIKIKDLID